MLFSIEKNWLFIKLLINKSNLSKKSITNNNNKVWIFHELNGEMNYWIGFFDQIHFEVLCVIIDIVWISLRILTGDSEINYHDMEWDLIKFYPQLPSSIQKSSNDKKVMTNLIVALTWWSIQK